MTKTKFDSYVNQFKALIEGDDSAAKAEKAWRGSVSALKVALSASEGDLLKYEDDLEQAKENLDKARMNFGEEKVNRDVFVSKLMKAKIKVLECEDDLALHKEKIVSLSEELAYLQDN